MTPREVDGLEGGPDSRRAVVTVGTYDGVHLGHRRLIEKTKTIAKLLGCKSVVVTFSVHPATVLRPDHPVPLLCTLKDKVAILEATGVDEVKVLDFDLEHAKESAEDFVLQELVEALRVKEIVVGSNFRFGYRRRGDVRLMQEMGKANDFRARAIDLVLDDEHHSVVSSSRIRALLEEGEILEASRLLGRPYSIAGSLEETGRFDPSPELLVPPEGRYEAALALGGGLPATGTSDRFVIEIDAASKVHLPSVTGAHAPPGEVALAFYGDRESSSDSHL